MKRFVKKGYGRSATALVCVVLSVVLLLNMDRQVWFLVADNLTLWTLSLAMPEGAIAMLEERYSTEIVTPTPSPTLSPSPSPLPPSSSQTPTQTTEPSSTPTPIKTPTPTPADIPLQYRGEVLEEDMSLYDSGAILNWNGVFVNNYTAATETSVMQKLDNTAPLVLEDSTEPQVLIVHTHATEAYLPFDGEYYDTRYNWRSTDNTNNVVAVGAALADTLRSYGINVIHDTTQHDYPSYDGAYANSEETVSAYLKEHPTIQVVFDVHRDAIERDGVVVKPTALIDGEKAAQVMIIACADDGKMDNPDWEENFRFAADITEQMQEDYPTLAKPIFLAYRDYNQHLSTGSLLLEVGGHGNTLEEAVYSAKLIGEAVGRLLTE